MVTNSRHRRGVRETVPICNRLLSRYKRNTAATTTRMKCPFHTFRTIQPFHIMPFLLSILTHHNWFRFLRTILESLLHMQVKPITIQYVWITLDDKRRVTAFTSNPAVYAVAAITYMVRSSFMRASPQNTRQ